MPRMSDDEAREQQAKAPIGTWWDSKQGVCRVIRHRGSRLYSLVTRYENGDLDIEELQDLRPVVADATVLALAYPYLASLSFEERE